MKVLVIGAGASGLMAAAIAGQNNHFVTILEKTKRAGTKLSITGKGRCNLTNNCDTNTLLNHVTSNAKFLFSAFSKFNSLDTMKTFEQLGVKLKTERGNRVFPESDSAMDIVKALLRLNDNESKIKYNCCVKQLLIENSTVRGVVLHDGTKLYSDAVIICTGGQSYPKTGSTGDGYRLAKQAGHTVTELHPSLVPIVCREAWCRDLMGLSLRNVGVTVYENHKLIYKEQGEMMFTHFGISGPVILSASAHINDIDNCKICIDMKPALSDEKLNKRILSDFSKYSNRNFSNSLKDLLPQKMIHTFVKLSGIDAQIKTNQMTREMRESVVRLMKNIEINALCFRPIEEAIITRGGVSVKEIDPKTMQSKLCKGLYFAGEVIDTDAYTGGFNLQIAFSTAYTAGTSI